MMETEEDDYFLDPGYGYEDLTFLEACLENDLDAVGAILEDNPTEEEINERDRCGRTGLSHLCTSGLTPALEILAGVPEVDVNLPDKEGNTPLIFAAQAGHTDAVRLLLQDFKGIRIDQPNRLGMTALMKSAIQGRTDCSRLLLYAGADPKSKDHGRKLCAEEWAAYCGRRDCADVIAKFSNTKSFYLKSREAERSAGLRLERSNSLPDLAKDAISTATPRPQHKRASLRKKIKKILPGTNQCSDPMNNTLSVTPGSKSPFAVIARCVSTPVIPGAINTGSPNPALKRPVSVDNIPRVEVTHPPKEDGVPDHEGASIGTGRSLRSRRRHCHSSSCGNSNNTTTTTTTTTSSSSSSSTSSPSAPNNATTTTTTTSTSSNNNTDGSNGGGNSKSTIRNSASTSNFADEYVTVT